MSNRDARFQVIYFPIGGRAEPIRHALYIAGIPFEDRFISGETLGKMKASGETRYAGVPDVIILENGLKTFRMGQTGAILRYIGEITGSLYPSEPLQTFERFLVDELLAACEDFVGLIVPSIMESDADKKKAMREELVNNKMKFPLWLGRLEKRLEESEKRCQENDEKWNGYVVGNSLTVADLKLYTSIKFFGTDFLDHVPTTILDPYPRLRAFKDKIRNEKKVQEFDALFAENTKAFKEGKNKDGIFYYPCAAATPKLLAVIDSALDALYKA